MAFSSGFSPHPRISYANAAPTGVASEAEYVEIGVVTRCDPLDIRQRLDAALPPGLDIVDVVEALTPDFAARLEASRWSIELAGVTRATLADAVDTLMACAEAPIERMTKGGLRTIDVRSAILAAEVVDSDPDATHATAEIPSSSPCAILKVVVRQVTPTVRPDDILAALRSVADFVPPVPALVTREQQGPLAAEGVFIQDPLAPDRESAGADGTPVVP
jgi:radical SAM-linked protein